MRTLRELTSLHIPVNFDRASANTSETQAMRRHTRTAFVVAALALLVAMVAPAAEVRLNKLPSAHRVLSQPERFLQRLHTQIPPPAGLAARSRPVAS